MKQFICLVKKEWLLLLRDKMALAVLFMMPAFFVLIISLFQFHNRSDSHFSVLFYSQSHGKVVSKIKSELQASAQFDFIDVKEKFNNNLAKAKQAVNTGQYSALIIFPKNFDNAIKKYSKQQLTHTQDGQATPKIKLYFDPAISKYTISGIEQLLTQQILHFQLQISAEMLASILGNKTSIMPSPNNLLETHYASAKAHQLKPNVVQQNVPAWAIFGMFFIAIPIAGILIRERQLTISQRILMAPVSKFTVITARVFAFVIVNLSQLALMLLVGAYLLPIFGLPSLVLVQPVLFLLVSIITAIAATSFGIFIGTAARTYEQASALAPLLIVLAAAIGGIMFPTYLMPSSLQVWSHLSPLNWAQTAFIQVLVRENSLSAIVPSLCNLLMFSIIALSLSSFIQRKTRQR